MTGDDERDATGRARLRKEEISGSTRPCDGWILKSLFGVF